MPSLDPYLLQPMTLLDAVNICLERGLGTGAVMSLSSADMNADAAASLRTLHAVLVQTQTKGWQWNREVGLVLDPSPVDGSITLPSNTLKVDTIWKDAGINVVQRGRKLYLPEGSTYNIGRSVTVDLVVALDFQDLPQVMRNYVTVKAARIIGATKLSNPLVNQFTGEQEVQALIDLEEAEDESDDRTLYEKNGHLARMHAHRRRT